MFNENLPLVDLHRHLDGNILPATVWDLGHKHGIELPGNSLAEFTKHAQIQGQTSDLLAFLQKLDYGVSVLADYDSIYRIAKENILDAKAQGLNYTELRFSPFYMSQAFNLNLSEVVNVTADAVMSTAKEVGIGVNLIGILSRTFGVDACSKELDAILAHKDKICALDLAGDEINYPAELFVDHFKQARDAGLNITVHAGEADGPQSVWNAIELLGATRIGHGVKAIEDPKLMSYLADNDIVIESCPTSNFQTATVTDLTQHPLPKFLDAGVKVCLNTDDPAVSNITIKHEYEVVSDVLKLNDTQIEQIQRNGVNAAFISDEEKRQLFENQA